MQGLIATLFTDLTPVSSQVVNGVSLFLIQSSRRNATPLEQTFYTPSFRSYLASLVLFALDPFTHHSQMRFLTHNYVGQPISNQN